MFTAGAIFYFQNSNKESGYLAGILALTFLLINLSWFEVKNRIYWKKHPEEYFIAQKENTFIHNEGKKKIIIPIDKIKSIEDDPIPGRILINNYIHIVYMENEKEKHYAFPTFSKPRYANGNQKIDLAYNITAEELRAKLAQ